MSFSHIIKSFLDYYKMALQIFSESTWSVKTVVADGQPWFCAKDIAKAFGYALPRKAVLDHVFEEDRVRLQDLGRSQMEPPLKNEQGHSVYISEPGVYALIFGSKLESAKVFKKWVCQEVLPKLRKSFHEQQCAPLYLRNETELHHKVISFIRRFYPHALIAACMGELQDTSQKRLDSWRKGYQAGTPDIIILNLHAKYSGFAIELKSPKGNGVVSQKQSDCLEQYRMADFKTLVSGEYDVILIELVNYFENTRLRCPHCCKKFKTNGSLQKHLCHFHRITCA
jgi:prophage antirepressor-like protein